MATNVTLNGVTYTIPQTGDDSWSVGLGVDAYLVAAASGFLSKAGGQFTLASDVDFGASFGPKAIYIKSRTLNPATTGVLRLANVDAVTWRNSGNSADLALKPGSADGLLAYNGVDLCDKSTAQTLTNKTIQISGTTKAVFTDGSGNLTTSGTPATNVTNFATLADGTAGQVLTTLAGNTGYQWAAALTTTLAQNNVTVGNASNTATSANTALLGDVQGNIASATATISIAAPGVVTMNNAFVGGETVYFTTTGALPTGLTASTTYYVASPTGTTFQLSATKGGPSITTTGSQSGTHTCVSGGLVLKSSGSRVIPVAFTSSTTSPGTNQTIGDSAASVQAYTPSASISVTLDNTHVVGRIITIINNAAIASNGGTTITVKANDGTTVRTLYATERAQFLCLSSTPTTNTNWDCLTPAISPWYSWTPTFYSATEPTWTNKAGYWRRVGDSMEIKFHGRSSGAGSGTIIYLTTPASRTLDSTKEWEQINTAGIYGTGVFSSAGASYIGVTIENDNSTDLTLMRYDTANYLSAASFGTTSDLYFNYTIPISGWTQTKG